jgi:opacity protein-like surface antigen
MITDSGIGRLVLCVPATVLLLGSGGLGVAEAQGEAPLHEVFVGYAPLRDLEIETNFPLGWNLSLARNLTNSVGIVADFGGNYKDFEGANLNLHGFLGGVRYSFRSERVSPYVEALAGAVRAAASAAGESASATDFAVQGGLGLGVRVTENVSLRTGFDYRNIFSEGESLQQFRVVAGVSLGFGGPLNGSGPSQPREPSAARSGGGYGAETPNWEMSASYAFLRDQELETNFPLGWNVSMARNVTDSLGVVADVGGNYKSVEGVDLNIHAFLGGLRYSFRGERVTPYVEVLAGAARAGVSALGVSDSATDFALQGGIGLGVKVAENVWVRAGGDFRNIFTEGESAQEFRATAGLTFGFGGTRSPAVVPEPPPPPPPVRAPVREPATQAAPPPQPRTAPVEAPVQPVQPARPSAPATPALARLAQGHEALRAGSFSQASDAFREYLGVYASHKLTIPVGIYCDPANVSQQVSNAGGSEELFLIRLLRRGQLCYGLYWGVFGSRAEAETGLSRVPPALRASGQAPISVSRILSLAR